MLTKVYSEQVRTVEVRAVGGSEDPQVPHQGPATELPGLAGDGDHPGVLQLSTLHPPHDPLLAPPEPALAASQLRPCTELSANTWYQTLTVTLNQHKQSPALAS